MQGAIFATLSAGFYALLWAFSAWPRREHAPSDQRDLVFWHPYPFGIYCSAVAFIIVFRANFAYQRYFDATSWNFQMLSKWLDVGIQVKSLFPWKWVQYLSLFAFLNLQFDHIGSCISPTILRESPGSQQTKQSS
jgi:predicted membrane chloride channel (bestrophin family)